MAMLYLRNKPIGAISSGASGGGHTIENPSGTDMTQRSNLQFTDADVADDSTNDRTEISVVRKLTQAEFDELTPEEQNRGVIVIKDANPIYVPSNNAVSVTADGVKTWGTLLNELYTKIDVNKIALHSLLVINNASVLGITSINSSALRFDNSVSLGTATYVSNITISGTLADCKNKSTTITSNSTSVSDISNNAPDAGDTITLYYTSTTKVIESCDAQDVGYGGGTVEDVLDSLTASIAKTFVELGGQNDIGGAWDSLTVYDRPVLCAWTQNGRHWGLLYKYTGGQFGMGISQAYYSTVINVLSVSGGTKTIKSLTAQ